MKTYVRRCQECGKSDSYPPPPVNPTDEQYWQWGGTKCKHCKSSGLDFGSWRDPNKTKE